MPTTESNEVAIEMEASPNNDNQHIVGDNGDKMNKDRNTLKKPKSVFDAR